MSELKGFQRLSKDELLKICSKGGKNAHKLGRAHEWTPAQASEAGKKGGKISAQLKSISARLKKDAKNINNQSDN